jgi:DNA-binding FrmR family transcriptional regulator
MGNRNDLIGSLRRVANALWVKNTLEYILLVGFYFIILVALAAILTKLGILVLYIWDYLLILGIGFVFGFSIGLSRRPSLYQTAVFLDDAMLLNNRLAASLECTVKPSPNSIEKLLLRETETIRFRISPAIVYKRLNTNYIFQFALSVLGIIVIWLAPITFSQAEETLNDLMDNQAGKLTNTLQSFRNKSDLDAMTKSLSDQMESIAQAIKDGNDPEEVLKQLEELKEKTAKELQQIETAHKLSEQIVLIFNKSSSPELLSNPAEINKLMKEIETALVNGQVSVDMFNQLKDALKEAIDKMPSEMLNQNLTEGLEALENKPVPDSGKFSEPLQQFFEAIARKNRQVMETIQTRLKIAEREIKEAISKYQSGSTQPSSSPEQTGFSLANDTAYAPQHPSGGAPDIVRNIPVPPDTPVERIELLQEVIKARARALENHAWPSKYDELIKEYFQ